MASPPSILVPDEEEEIKAWLQEHGFNGKDGYRDWKEEKNPQARLGKMKGPMKLACSLGLESASQLDLAALGKLPMLLPTGTSTVCISYGDAVDSSRGACNCQ